MERERRTNTVTDIEVRENDDGGIAFTGHPAVFNRLSEPIMGAFVEQVDPDAFTVTIGEDRADVRMLVNHDGVPIARTKSGTLELTTDDVGLRSHAPSLDGRNPTVVELASAMGRGDLDQMSFGFRTIREDMDYEATPLPIRTLLEVQLFDVSPVTFPAYPDTDAEMNGLIVVPLELRSRLGIRAAIPSHDTSVQEGDWDGPSAVASMPAEAATLRYCHAWFLGGDADPDAKASYKFPHHATSGGPANLPGVRNGLSRLPQADIPDGDRGGVEAHLRAHLEAAEEEASEENDARGALLDFDAALVQIVEDSREGKVLSASSEEKVRAAIEALKALLAAATKDEANASHYRSVAAARDRLLALAHRS